MWIDANIGWVLEISGLATCSMLLYALAPRMVHEFVFGMDVREPSAVLALRSWGVMIFGAGALLVYGAYHPEFRDAILVYSIAGKTSFIVPVLFDSERLLRKPAFAMAMADIVMVALFAWYLLS